MVKSNYKAIALVLGLITISFLFVWYVFAQFTEPTATPPGGNVPAPINVGSVTQGRLGDLGIGTTSPLSRLHIDAGGANPTAQIESTGTLEFGRGFAKEVNAGKIGYNTFYTGIGGTGSLNIVGGGTLGSNRRIDFWNEGGATFRGNVGIGTTSPGHKLDVRGQMRADRYNDNVAGWYVDSDVTSRMNNIDLAGTIYANNWFRSRGATGWYNQTYGGGWYMSDTTWIRAYNSKRVYTPSIMRADGGFQVDGRQVIDANASWHRSYGNAGWYNQTYGGGWYMTDTTWIRAYNNKWVYTAGRIRGDGGLYEGANRVCTAANGVCDSRYTRRTYVKFQSCSSTTTGCRAFCNAASHLITGSGGGAGTGARYLRVVQPIRTTTDYTFCSRNVSGVSWHCNAVCSLN